MLAAPTLTPLMTAIVDNYAPTNRYRQIQEIFSQTAELEY